MPYRHNIAYSLEEHVGAEGASAKQLSALLDRLSDSFNGIKAHKNPQVSPLLVMADRTDDLEDFTAIAADIRARFSHVVVAGAGGSGLSGRALATLCPATNLHFLETIDPDAIDALLATASIENTHFIFISKSGTTAETLAQFFALLALARQTLKVNLSEHFTVITSDRESPLRQAAQKYGMRVLDHAPDIGGRFAILTGVGLLPAALAGLDIKALRRGAAQIVKRLRETAAAKDFAPAIGAALHVALMDKDKKVCVLMPYGERLSGLAAWWRQCWAESLGKNGKGSTPIRASGPTDQHSQLQLYLDGPKDKFFHLITLNQSHRGQKIMAPGSEELAYLQGKTTGDMMNAEQQATLETLVKHCCPVRVLELDQFTEETMGALLMHFMLEVVFTAALLDVNPFDQPAVEEGKRLARDYLLAGKS